MLGDYAMDLKLSTLTKELHDQTSLRAEISWICDERRARRRAHDHTGSVDLPRPVAPVRSSEDEVQQDSADGSDERETLLSRQVSGLRGLEPGAEALDREGPRG